MPEPFGNFQFEIYMQGLSGTKPPFPIAYADLEARAKEVLKPEAYDYVAGGAGSEDTVRENLEAFRRWRIVPRMLRGVAERDLSTEIFGRTLPAPVLLAPVGVQSIVHPEAELATAQGAAGQASGGGRRGGGDGVGIGVPESRLGLGRPRVPPGPHRPADPAEGHRASEGREEGRRRRRERDRRVEPRRAAGGRRDRHA